MGMKEIRDQVIPVHEANARVGEDFSPAMWEFLVRRMNYPAMRFHRETATISCPGFVPFAEFFQGVIAEVKTGALDARPCRVCSRVFNVNAESGIFARPDALEGFICETCARALSAWDFFHDHLT